MLAPSSAGFRRLLPLLVPYRSALLAGGACMLVFVVCWPLLAWLAGQLLPAIGAGDFDRVLQVIGLALSVFMLQKLAQFTYRNGIHFSHNSGVVRWHHLGTVIKVGFKSIIMRRVTRSDYHSGMSFQPTHRKAELRGWPGAVENKSLSAKPGPS